MTSPRLLAAALLAALFCRADAPLPLQPAENRPLAERFAQPPPSARILPIFHSLKDDPAQQDKQLTTLSNRGFGGFVGNVSFQGYVDDETKWPPFIRGVNLAREAGMTLWLYDECGYPSGSARDLTLKGHPEWAARGLLVAETNTAGGPVSLALPPGRLVLAAALPRRNGAVALDAAIDLSAAVSDATLSWHAPAGDWFVVAMTDDLIYDGTHAAVSVAYKNPCIDLLTPEPTARFIQVTHERYAEKLGRDLGRIFAATFTDEPSLQNLWFRPMPYRVLPWSLTLPRDYHARNGHDLLPLLPALVTDAGPAGAKARYDFWNTIADLVAENYFGQIQAWCRRHNIPSGGHLLMEEGLVGHVPLYGDFFRSARRLDAPSIDCLTSLPPQVPWFIARKISSIADLEGRTLTMCEVSDHSQRYRPAGDTRPPVTVSEDEIRGTCHRLLWGGINTLTSYYSFRDLTDDQLRRLNTQLGRVSTLMAGGRQVSDIALLYPVESVWPKFIPAFKGPSDEPAARRVETVFDNVGSALYGANRDFTYIDARALRDARPQGDALVHGPLRWRVLILPATDTLPLAAWQNIAAFWRKGGAVIAVGARPANSEDAFPSPRVQALASELFGPGDGPSVNANRAGGAAILLPSGMTALLPRLLDALIERDAAAPDAAPIRTTRRLIDGHHVYLAINDSAEPWQGTLAFPAPGVAEQWDPVTGAMHLLADATRVPVRLGPYGAIGFRAPHIRPPARLRGASAANLSMTCQPLPFAPAATVGKGQYVTCAFAGSHAEGWRADATLTKGAVDTHLFMSFALTEPAALADAAGLMIEASVPEGQRTPAELLVFLHTRDGADYLAGTGHFLNTPGTRRAYAMFSQFRPFGDKAKAALNPADVTAIRVGWGGYFGAEGEPVSLTVKPPQRFTCGPR